MAFKRVELDLGKYEPKLVAPGVGVWRYEKPLPLTTDGQLRLIALGVGAGFSNKMHQSNFIIVKGQTALFVDLGTKATVRLAEFGLSAHDIDHLLITHSHSDHAGSLEELALKRYYETPWLRLKKDNEETDAAFTQRIGVAQRNGDYRPLLYAPYQYASTLWEETLKTCLSPGNQTTMMDFFKLALLSEQGLDWWRWSGIGDIDVIAFRTKHVPADEAERMGCAHTVGLVIDKRLFISGDTRFDPLIIEHLGQYCEMLAHDCQHYPGGVHANYRELKTLPAEIRSRMYLYHLSDGMLDIDVKADGFAGLLEAAPIVYDFD